jgi:hypothetical protein
MGRSGLQDGGGREPVAGVAVGVGFQGFLIIGLPS